MKSHKYIRSIAFASVVGENTKRQRDGEDQRRKNESDFPENGLVFV
jgi:hypothetical protein